MDQKPKLFVDLPSDVLLRVFSECCVLDILNLSSTCKQLQRVADEYQVWLDQARSLQIPIPPRKAPSKAELKDLVISRTRVDVCWTKSRPSDLSLHLFETESYFVDAHFIPGGEFVVLLYDDGDIGLNKIERSEVMGGLKVREVARYKEMRIYQCPERWSRLLMETSYGCPVLILLGLMDSGDPKVFLIDPVSQVIEKKKQDTHCHLKEATIPDVDILKILAIKNRMFFICEGMEGTTWIIVIEELGQNAVAKRLLLALPAEYDTPKARFFVVSENCFVATNYCGIWLYHIPELGAVDEDTKLVPFWSRLLDASEFRGTFYKTASPYPALWLQGKRTTHTIEFDVDESGYYPVVVNHITEGQPAFYVGNTLKLKGRKGMSIETEWEDEIVINTGVLGKPGTRRLRAPIPGLNIGIEFMRDEVRYTDLDEVTGRILVVVGQEDIEEDAHYAKKLYIAELPT